MGTTRSEQADRTRESSVVLIIDDSDSDLAYYKRCLTRHGFIVLTAPNGEQGLKKLQLMPVHCILVDYRLPTISGVNVLTHVLDDPGQRSVPVILMAGEGTEATAVTAWKLGAADYVNKADLTPERLVKVVTSAVATRRAMLDNAECRLGLEAENKMLRERLDEMRRYCHSVTQELRAPLAACREFVSVVRDGTEGALTDGQDTMLDLALESCDQLSGHVQDLLDLASINGGKTRIVQRPFDLEGAVSRAVASSMETSRRRGVRISSVIDDELPRVIGDEHRIVQVLANLIGNAVHSTASGKTVVLKAELCAGKAAISVRDEDSDLGQPQENDATETPYRAAPPAIDNVSAGLGMTVSQEIVRRHGSSLEIDNRPGSGTAFQFSMLCERLAVDMVLPTDRPVIGDV